MGWEAIEITLILLNLLGALSLLSSPAIPPLVSPISNSINLLLRGKEESIEILLLIVFLSNSVNFSLVVVLS